MNADRLLKHYERIADAPDAVMRLRRFILDLAVRGKLVPQDPMDERAPELLKRIAAEKTRLVKSGTIRKPRDLDDGGPPDGPFAIPATWSWVRLDAVGLIIGGGTPSATDAENFAEPGNGIPWLTPADLGGYVDIYISRGARDLSEKGLRSSTATIMSAGTVLFTSRAPIGYVAIAANPISTNQGFKSIAPYVSDCSPFIAMAMKAFVPDIELRAPGTTFKEVSGKIVAGIRFPLPPLAEQYRIVAKVDELMALCDKLDAARAEREAQRDRFAAATLARLNAPKPDPAIFADHAQSAIKLLKALTTRPDQIKQLRQAILNLAVRGKLAPQDPNDEPASELLKRIRKWSHEAILGKQIRAPRKPLKPISENGSPHLFPNGWERARLGELIYIKSGDGLTATNMQDGDVPVFGGNGINGFHDKSNVERQTIVIGRVGYYCGSIHVTPLKAWVTDNAFSTHFCQEALYLRFLALLLKGTNLKQDESATAQPVISGSKIYPIVVGLPPLPEQHRIVSKVDELMALCDRLESSLAVDGDIRSSLFGALLAEALA